jgi:hypothetical protein
MRQFNKLTAKILCSFTLLFLFVITGFSQAESESNDDFSTANLASFNSEATGSVCPGDVDFYKFVVPRDGVVRVHTEATNTGSSWGILHVSGFDQRRENGNLFNNTPAYYSDPGAISQDNADLYCRSKGDTIYIKVTQDNQCYSYKLSFSMLGAATANDIETNNSYITATKFNTGDTLTGHIGYVTATGGVDDVDYYKTVLPKDGVYRIYMEATNTGNGSGIMWVSGYDQRQDNGNLFNATPAYYTDAGSTRLDSTDLFCRSAGDTIYLKVTNANQCFSYRITYKMISAPTDNDLEPNDNYDQATMFKMGDTAKGHIGYIAAGGVTDGVDVYKTVLPADGKYRIYMEGTNTGNGNGILYVSGYDQRRDAGNLFNSTPAYYSAPGVTMIDSADLYCRSAGDTIYFRVSQANQCYNYKISYKMIGSPSDNDLEPNGTFEQAKQFNRGDTAKGHIGYVAAGGVVDDADFYKTVVPKDGVVRVYMEATNTGNGNGILYVAGYDRQKDAGNLFNSTPAYYSAPGVTMIDSVDLFGRSAGDTFYFKITQANQCYNYKLSYKVITPLIPNDVEPNNTFVQATNFKVRDTVQGHIGYMSGGVNDQQDVYKSLLPIEGTVKVRIEATNTGNANGLLYLNMYDSKQANIYNRTVAYYLNAGATAYDSFTVSCRAVDTTFFLLNSGSQPFTYKFSYEMISSSAGVSDPEPNNSFDQATLINAGDSVRGNIGHYTANGSDDVDYFKTKVPRKGTMQVFVEATNTGDGGSGLFYISGYDSNKNQVFNRTPAYYTTGGTVSVDNFNLYCRDADSFYFKIERASECYSYKLKYTITLGADTTVYTCSGCTTNIGKLYDVTPFSEVKYVSMASPATSISPDNVVGGTYMLTVSNGADECSRDTAIITVSSGQAIQFDSIPDKTFGAAPFKVVAKSTAGLPLTYKILSGPATVSHDTVTVTGVGLVTVRAEQAGNATYNYALADRTFKVNKASATITLSNKVKTYDGKASTPTAVTNPASLPVTYTFNGSSNIPVNAGKYLVTATINSTNYAGSIIDSFFVNKANQTVSITPIPDQQFSTSPFNVAASASSGLPVTLTVSTTPANIASVSGNTITLTGLGTVYVNAVQNGNENYNASFVVSDTFVVTKGNQTITFADIPDHAIGDTLVLIAKASSGLPVSYSIATIPTSGVAKLSHDTITLGNVTGTVTVTATQAGNSNYNSTQIQKTFNVTGKSQTITFAAIPNKILGDAPFAISATASSGLPVSFRIVSGPATVNNDTITPTNDGIVVVEANQSGNNVYAAAPAVQQSFSVIRKYPDLFVQSVVADKTNIQPNDIVSLSWKVSNVGEVASTVDWTERIYIQSASGENRTFITQIPFSTNNTLAIGASLSRSEKVTLPSQFNVGDQGVFVVELVPGTTIKEAVGAQANNTAVQQTAMAVQKLLSVEVSSSEITEGSSDGTSVKVSRTGSLINSLTVSVSLNNPARFSYPSTITIPAGQSAYTFTLTAINNTAIEGTISDALSVSATGFTGAIANLSILDDDKPSLSITQLPADAMEGQTVTFKINTNLAPKQALQVFLTSNNQLRFPVPASVTIPAGALSADVSVTLEQDQIPEVDLPVTIVAGAANNNSANATIQIKDDDLPGLELAVQTNIIPESAGYYATQATLRRKANSNPIAFSATISADLSNTLILPTSISLAAGENEKTFNIGVIDNAHVDGDRKVTITASMFVNSCGCNASSTSSGSVSTSVTVTDNDGPALQVTAPQLTLPEGSTAGSIRITRNTSTRDALTVNLTSSNTGEATVPATAVVPAGQSYVDVTITTINDNVTDGNKQVYLQASSSGFSTGSVWVIVSDQNKPDLLIPAVSLSNQSVQAMSVFNYQVSVKNAGFATAPAGVVVRGYLSLDDVIDNSDSLISEDVISSAIPAGQTTQVLNAIKMPNLPGSYKLLYWVNPDLTLSELLSTNNTSWPQNINIKPDYTATAIVDNTYFLKGTTIDVHGSAVRTNGSAAANEKVEVYVITNGVRRTILTNTDALGRFTTQFVPLGNEAGHYSIGASYPGIGTTTEQDNFDILGVRINDGNTPQFKVVFNDTLKGTLTIQNVSNKTLTNFSLAGVTLPNGASIKFGTIASLAGNSTANLDYTAIGTSLSAGNSFQVAQFKATSNEGNIQPATVYYYCKAPDGYLEADVATINVTASQTAGERVVEFRVVNKGMGSTGDITVSLPQVNWLSSVTPNALPSLGPGDTAVITLKFQPLPEIPFDYPISSNIAINSQNGNSISIPFSFEKVSESSGSVKVTVTDQFTYYTAGAPKVAGAHVQIKNYYTGEMYAEGNTDTSGVFVATGVPEGQHRIVVEKEKHEPYTGTVTVNPGKTLEAPVFLNYQAITFNWSVVPTAIQDQYDITLEAQFETNVPEPVVIIDMPKTMPQLSGTEQYAFNATLTNHGLITAKDVTLSLPTGDPEYEFITNYVPADLLAQQSIQVPVIMRRRTTAPSGGRASVASVSRFLGVAPPQYRTAASQALNCQDFTSVSYWYKCNLTTGLWEKGGTLFSYSGRSCTGGPTPAYTGVPVDVGNVPTSDDGGYNDVPCAECGPGNGIVIYNPFPPTKAEKKSCKQCINDVAGALSGCTGVGGAGFGAASCAYGNWLDQKSAAEYLACVPLPIPPPLGCLMGVNNAMGTCASTSAAGSGRAANKGASSPLGAAFDQLAVNLKLVEDAYTARENWSREYFGNMIASDAIDHFSALVENYVTNLDSIRPDAQATILAGMAGYEIQPSAINAFFTRWNTSITARKAGVLEPNTKYPDIINWNKVKGYSDFMSNATQQSLDKGFSSVYDMYQKEYKSLKALIDSQSQTVCASVTMQLSQRLTMTREAFEGTLEIYNGHPTDKMDSLSVSIQITDENGVPSNGLFEIQTKSLSNLSDITGTGAIAAQQKGGVKFLFIPTVNAAPTQSKVYNFAGSVRYWDPYARAMVTMPLSPVPLTVNPSPNLMLHYFMERNILGDDPLTNPDIEPSVPAELAVMVENQGYGSAVNMTISSAQPKIVENEKGLAINFKLIGSNFQGQPTNFGVTNINFGTVPALQTRIGQWYFTSSLLGKFVSYDAKVVHANSFGNPDLSLVKGVKMHELTHSIREYGAKDDAINDFLVNDIFDTHDVPDIIYFSQGNRTAKLVEAASGSFSSPVMPPSFTNKLTVTASGAGWNYIKLDDPGKKLYDIASVTRGDGQVIPLNNAWVSFVTLPLGQAPLYENKFHFVDTFASTQPVTYTVVWKPRNVDVPKVDTIMGAPKEVTATQVQNLKVVFNKKIDPSTFTYQDLTLTFQGGANIIDSTVAITQLDTATFNVDLSKITTGNGAYAFTVQAANVSDVYGTNGTAGKQVIWSQFLNVPTVQEFQGIPDSHVAASYNKMQVLFNLPIDPATVTPARFTIMKDSVVQAGSVTIDSVRADHKLFYLSGLQNILTQNGAYQFVVDLPNIKSENQVAGVQSQSVTLTVDNTGPIVVSLQKSNVGGLDAQHIPNVNIKFNEDVYGFNTASIQVTRNGEIIPLNIDQLSNTDLKTWIVGNFGMATYPEGNYTLTIDLTGVKDAIGNAGTGKQQISWTVNRSAIVDVTNLSVTPDLGYSNTDGVTAGQSLNAKFHLSADASQVTVSQVDIGGELVLATVGKVAAGDVSVPVTLPTSGNTGIKVTALGENGGIGTAQITLFVDQVPLTGQWLFAKNQTLSRQIDSMQLSLSSKLLTTKGFLNAIQLKRNGAAISTTALTWKALNDTLYEVDGIRNAGTTAGTYELSFSLPSFSKYTSGKTGAESILVSWTVAAINHAPIADAGSDTTITTATIVALNGATSKDPDFDPITYHWVAPGGVVLSDSTAANPSFTVTNANDGNVYSFLLIVSDGSLFTTDVVNVVVNLAGSTLPVNFTSMKGYQKNEGVQVDWNVATESNINHYDIEKSTNGQDFIHVADVTPTSNNSSAASYSWVDANPSEGNNFYRIKAVENSGSVKVSKVVLVRIAAVNKSITVYPNPVTNKKISLQLNNQPKGKYNVQLFNGLGQQMFNKSIVHNGGSATYSIELAPVVSKGIYQLYITNGENTINQQLIVQ